jgi:hypothetical protein
MWVWFCSFWVLVEVEEEEEDWSGRKRLRKARRQASEAASRKPEAMP